MPRPPGVIGTTAMMLARPNATINKSRLTLPPNARKNTQSAAASSNQFNAAHPSTRNNNFGSAARPCNRLPKCCNVSAARSSFMRNLRAMKRNARSALPCPSMTPNTRPAATSITMTPTKAAEPYAAFTPRPGIDAIKPTHKMRFNTTAEPRPAVASAKPASGPDTPDNVSMR